MISRDAAMDRVESGEWAVMNVVIPVYVDRKSLERKMGCPMCQRVFDKFLVAQNGIIGCVYCVAGEFVRKGVDALRSFLDKEVDKIFYDGRWRSVTKEGVEFLLMELQREILDEIK